MKKFILLLLLASPLMSFAQHDDIYFVPTREKKVVASVTETENLVLIEDEDEWCDEEAYYTDDYGYDDEDYRYSTRIVRFRNNGYIGSPLYWELTYNCGINDWIVYDDGYYLDIYPTYSNTLYYWPRTSYGYWGWNSWYYPNSYWRYGCWGYNHCHPAYHWNGYYPHHVHGGYRPSYIVNNSWRPAHKVHKDIPLNKGGRNVAGTSIATNNGVRRENSALRPGTGNGRVSGGQNVQTSNRVNATASGVRNNTVNRSNGVRSTAVQRQQPQRVTNGGAVNNGSAAVRPQQPRRTSSGTSVGQSGGSKSQEVRMRTNSERRPQTSTSSSSSQSRSSYRSSSSSSGEYNRPSSTSVSRQRSSSSSGNPVGGFGTNSSRGGFGARGGARR